MLVSIYRSCVFLSASPLSRLARSNAISGLSVRSFPLTIANGVYPSSYESEIGGETGRLSIIDRNYRYIGVRGAWRAVDGTQRASDA